MKNRLKQLILGRATEIKTIWIDSIFNTYPAETVRFLKRERNRFNNPVGFTINREVETIFSYLLDIPQERSVEVSLENLIKIRSVQDFSASEAISMINKLRRIVQDEFAKEIKSEGLFSEYVELERQIEGIEGSAFDIYVASREKIYEIRTHETKNMMFKLLDRMNGVEIRLDEVPPPNGV